MKYSKRINNLEPTYNSKGITLIALILTVIVMLILAAISIDIIDKGIIEETGEAINKAKEDKQQEDREMDNTLEMLK